MITILHGADHQASRERLTELTGQLSVERYLATEQSLMSLTERLRSQGLFGERVVIITDGLVTHGEALIGLLVSTSSSASKLFLRERGVVADKLLHQLGRSAKVELFSPLTGTALKEFIASEARALEVTIAPAVIPALCEASRGDRLLITTILHSASGQSLTLADLEIRLPRSEGPIWPLLDRLFADNPTLALLELARARSTIDGYYLLSMINWQLRTIIEVGLGETVGLKPLVVSKARQYLKRVPLKRWEQQYQRLIGLEVALKTGEVTEEVAIDQFLLQLVFV